MAKKYLSKISKDGYTIYVKDLEAQEAISALPSYASTTTCESIIDELT